jgi:hypothetical protein
MWSQESTPQQMMGWIHRGATAPVVILLELVSRAQSRSEGKNEDNGYSARATVLCVSSWWMGSTMKQLLKHNVDCNLLIQPKQYKQFCYIYLYHHGSIGSKSFQG